MFLIVTTNLYQEKNIFCLHRAALACITVIFYIFWVALLGVKLNVLHQQAT